MHHFDPANPFPHWPDYGPPLYAPAKKHAAAADQWLGIDVDRTEAKLRDPGDGEERWLDRHSSVWLTPYVEIRAFLELVKPQPGQTVVDLGAGYGRGGFVMARHFPQARFLGFEIVAERVKEGAAALARFPAPQASLECANIAVPSWPLPEADIFFIYDFGSRESIAKVLEKLRERSRERGIQVIGRGRGVRDQIEREHPWLSSVHDPIHGPHVSVYRNFA